MQTNPRICEEREHLEGFSLVTYKSLGELVVLSTIGEAFHSASMLAFVEELLHMEWSMVEHLKAVRCSLSHAPVTAAFQHKCCRAEGWTNNRLGLAKHGNSKVGGSTENA
jgi:hypothetical protein